MWLRRREQDDTVMAPIRENVVGCCNDGTLTRCLGCR
jgi:hypothetical protein